MDESNEPLTLTEPLAPLHSHPSPSRLSLRTYADAYLAPCLLWLRASGIATWEKATIRQPLMMPLVTSIPVPSLARAESQGNFKKSITTFMDVYSNLQGLWLGAHDHLTPRLFQCMKCGLLLVQPRPSLPCFVVRTHTPRLW